MKSTLGVADCLLSGMPNFSSTSIEHACAPDGNFKPPLAQDCG